MATLADRAFAEGYIHRYDPAAFIYHWGQILDRGVGAVFGEVHDDEVLGALGCAVEADLYTGETLGREGFFYVRPDARSAALARELLDAFDGWCESKGCSRQLLSLHLTGRARSLDSLYRRRGWEPAAVEYSRDLAMIEQKEAV